MGITTQQSRLAVVRMMQSQLDLADAAKLARAAQDLAVISGQNSSEALGTIVQAIAAQRPILLKQFGIVKDLTEVYNDQAKLLGKNAQQLTQLEKKQAFVNVILAEAAKVSGSYEAAMQDVGKQLTSLPRYAEEASAALGLAFKPALEAAVSGTTEFLKGVRKALLEAFAPEELLEERITELNQGLAGQASKVNSLVAEYNDLKSQGELNTAQQLRLKEVIAELSGLVPAAVTEFSKYGEALDVNVELVKAFVEYSKELKEEAEGIKTENIIENIAEKEEDIRGYKDQFKELKDTLDDLADVAGRGDFKEFVETDVRRLAQGLKDGTIALTDIPFALRDGLNQTSIAYGNVNDIVDQLRQNVKGVEDDIDQTTIDMRRAGEELAKLEETRDRYLRNQTYDVITQPFAGLESGPFSSIEEREKALTWAKELADARIRILKDEGEISLTEYLEFLDKQLAATEKYSEDWKKLSIEQWEVQREIARAALEDINKLISVMFGGLQFPTKPYEGLFSSDPEGFRRDLAEGLYVMYGDLEERGFTFADDFANNLENNTIDAVRAIGDAFNFMFDQIDSDVATFVRSLTTAATSFVAGGPAGIIGGITSIFGGIHSLFSSGGESGRHGASVAEMQREYLKSQDRLRKSIEDLTAEMESSRTQSDITLLINTLSEYLRIWTSEDRSQLMYDNFIAGLDRLGLDTEGLTWGNLEHYLEQYLTGFQQMNELWQGALGATTFGQMQEILQSGELDFNQYQDIIDYWAEMHDLTTEQQMELWQIVGDILSESGDWTLQQQARWDLIMKDFEDVMTGVEGGTQIYRSVATITESQANLMQGTLNTLANINRGGFDRAGGLLEDIYDALSSNTAAFSGSQINISGNNFNYNGSAGNVSDFENEVARSLAGQIQAAGGRTIT
jgi:soluble cytochrome b562